MNKLILLVISAMFGLSLTTLVHSHPATERYIPIGYWAGVSDRYTYIGEIKTHDASNHSMSVVGSSGGKSIQITGQTRIWLDRSKQKLTNLKGSYSDCQPGRTIEVKFKGDSDTEAEWIKVRITR